MGEAKTSWVACSGCHAVMYGLGSRARWGVCAACGLHRPVDAPTRIAQLLDTGSARRLSAGHGALLTAADPHAGPAFEASPGTDAGAGFGAGLDLAADLEEEPQAGDPLGFTDIRAYSERLGEARERTGLSEAVLCCTGRIKGHPVVLAVMDFRFLGGSLGSATGERITLAAQAALRERAPLLLVTASGGARMQEGALSLMQMAKTSQVIAELDQAGVLTVSVITDPTFGGVAASFASLADVVLAEPGARFGFAGPRVIEQTTGRPLPAGFQSAERQFDRGQVDGVYPRALLRPVLARLLSAGGLGHQVPPDASGSRARDTRGARPPAGGAGVITDPAELPARPAWETVRLARQLGRPTVLDFVRATVEGFQELHGDRMSRDCPAIVGGLGRLAGRPVMVIGHQRGHTAAELMSRNFAMASPQGYRKAARLMRLASKLAIPVLTLIDTPGADPGLAAEEGGQAAAIAENLRLMARLPVPVVAIVLGEGGSGGALALGVANRVLICANAIYSVISPEGCAAILWKDSAAAPAAAEALGLDAAALLRHGIIDGAIPEPDGGAHLDPQAAMSGVRDAACAALADLSSWRPHELIRQRHERFRAIGSRQSQLEEAPR